MIALSSLLTTGCKRHFTVGDHVFVEWECADAGASVSKADCSYPAVILEAPSLSKYKVHYDGYDPVWDELVSRDRIRGYVEGQVNAPEPPAKVRDKVLQAAKTNHYKLNDHVRVEWHGQLYPALVRGIVGPERYLIAYDGYGPEWNETVGSARIQPLK
jgi:hypothetical protein